MRRAGSRGPAWPYAAAVVLPLAAVAAALYTQHMLNMQPCPWCVLQRLIYVCIAVAALPGLLLRSGTVRRASAVLVLGLCACGAAAALWQHFVAASSTSCVQTLADRIVQGLGLADALPEVFAAYASCAEAAVKLLGVPYDLWSLTMFVLVAACVLVTWRRTRR